MTDSQVYRKFTILNNRKKTMAGEGGGRNPTQPREDSAVTAMAELASAAREDLLRRAWYSHESRWYTAVAEELGIEVANRLNRRIVREIGRIEASRLRSALGAGQVSNLGEFLAFMQAGHELYVAAMVDIEVSPFDESTYEVAVARCFVAENIRRAGIGGSYECAVFDRLQGWHDALGLPLAESQLASRCAMFGGLPCRRVLTVQIPSAGGEP